MAAADSPNTNPLTRLKPTPTTAGATLQTATLEPEFTLLDDSIKRIGLYTKNDLPDLDKHIAVLAELLDKDGLYHNKTIYLRLNEETNSTKLTSDSGFRAGIDPAQHKNTLFLSDYLLILTTLAKLLESFQSTALLKPFTENYDDLTLLREWGESRELNGQEVISEVALQRNTYKIRGLLRDILAAFVEIQETQSGAAAEEQRQNEKVADGTLGAGAIVPAGIIGSSRVSATLEAMGDNADTPAIDTTDHEVRQRIVERLKFVIAHAQDRLINDFFRRAGMEISDLPPDVQNRLQRLTDLLWRELWIVVEALPPDELNRLLTESGDITFRIELFNRLLNRLLAQSGDVFLSELTEIYQSTITHTLQTDGAERVKALLDQVETVLDENQASASADFQRIRAKILSWKQQFLADLAQAAELPAVDADVPLTSRPLPPALARELEQRQGEIRDSDETPKPSLRNIQTHAAHLYWGTLAELFNSAEITDLGKLPPALTNAVQEQTLAYLLSLSSEEFAKIRSSPSSLIRHVKNNAGRLFQSNQFVEAYQVYGETKDSPILSRTDRIEKETEWAHTQLEFQLFGVHNITDETTPDEPGLQDVFDELKHALREEAYDYFDDLPSEKLEELYAKNPEREKLLTALRIELNNNPAFIKRLSEFYANLIAHRTAQDPSAGSRLADNLGRSVHYGGISYTLRDRAYKPAAALNETVKQTLGTDSGLLLTAISPTLDALLIGHGSEETARFISDARPELLAGVLGIDSQLITAANAAQFRSLLQQFATTRAAQLQATAGLPERGILAEEGPSPDYASAPASVVTKHLGGVPAIRTVISQAADDLDEAGQKVAEASGVSQKEKAKIFFKIYNDEWTQLNTIEKIVICLAMGVIVDAKLLKTKTPSPTEYIPLPIEYIDFKEKNKGGKLLKDLVTEYEKEGNLSSLTTIAIEQMEDEGVGTHMAEVERFRAALAATAYAQLEAEKQLEIALELGYEDIETLEKAILKQVDNQTLEDVARLPDSTEIIAREENRRLESQGGLLGFLGKGPQMASASQKLSAAFSALGKGKVTKAAVAKGASGLAARAGGAIAGPLGVAASAAMFALQNKRLREMILAGTTYVVSATLYALSTLGGMLGSGLLYFGALPFLGPVGALGAGFMGAHMGAQIAPWSWGNAVGFSPRTPPSFTSLLNPAEPIGPSQMSMEAMRAANANSAQAASAAAAQTAASTGAGGAAAPAASQAAAQATAAQTTAATAAASASSGAMGWLASLPIAIAAPALATASMMVLTIFTITVIVGAFLVPMPIRDSFWKDDRFVEQEQTSRFLNISKTASVSQIANNTPTEVTYTITITPQGNYGYRATAVEDRFSGFGIPTNKYMSPLNIGFFPDEVSSEPLELTYTLSIGDGLTDALVNNHVLLTFDAYDVNGYIIQRSQNISASTAVRVGEPKQACWPTSGTITQIPYYSTVKIKTHINADSFDIAGAEGTNVYAPFDGTACYDENWGPDPKTNLLALVEYGKLVRLESMIGGVSHRFIFAHLATSSIPWCKDGGKQVFAGELIGKMGSTGNSSGPHLHYELISPKPGNPGLLKDLVTDGQATINQFNSGRAPSVNHCY